MSGGFIGEQMAALTSRIAELERMVENTFRHGAVKEVDAEKHMMRMKIGKDADGNDVLSPWRPYAQMAGGLKVHTPVTEGQAMLLISPNGDFNQGFAVPVTWNQANQSPSDKGDENVITYGSATITLKGDELVVKIPKILLDVDGTTFELTGAGIKAAAADYQFD